MKTYIRGGIGAALWLAAASLLSAQNFTTFTASKIQDASGNLLASGQLCLTGVALNGQPIPFQAGGGGLVHTEPVCKAVTNGAVASFPIANSTLTYPLNVAYQIVVTDNTTGAAVLNVGPTQITGFTWSLDSYQPNLAPLALVQNGPPGAPGPAGAAATVTGNGTNGDFLVVGALRGKYGPFFDVTAWGAAGNGSADDTSALTQALAAAGTGAVYLPKGTYLINNSSGPVTFTGFNGKIFGAGSGSVIKCTSLANSCLVFQNSTWITISDLAITFNSAPSSRNGSQTLVVNSSSNVSLSHLYLHDGPSSALNLNSDTHVSIDSIVAANQLANGLFLVNNQDLKASNVTSTNNQDGGFEVSQYDGQSGTCSDVTLVSYTSFHDYTGIVVNGCVNVAVSGFTIHDTYLDPIIITQDNTTTTTAWPDQVVMANGIVRGAGVMNPPNSAVRGIHLDHSGTAPTKPMRVSFSSVRVEGGNSGANSVQIENDPWYTVSLAGVRVSNSGLTAFDIAGGHITMTDCEVDHAQGSGYVVRSAYSFTGYGLRAYDVQLGGGSTTAFQNTSTGSVFVHGLESSSDQSPSRVGVYDSAATGAHSFLGVSFITADGTTPGVTNNGSSGFYASTTIVNGAAVAPSNSVFRSVTATGDLTGTQYQMSIQGATNPNQQLQLGYDTSLNIGQIQAGIVGTGNKPLALNPNNGNVLVGTKTDNGNVLQVNGTSWLNGAVQIPGIKASSGLAPVCIDTSGNLVKGNCSGN